MIMSGWSMVGLYCVLGVLQLVCALQEGDLMVEAGKQKNPWRSRMVWGLLVLPLFVYSAWVSEFYFASGLFFGCILEYPVSECMVYAWHLHEAKIATLTAENEELKEELSHSCLYGHSVN